MHIQLHASAEMFLPVILWQRQKKGSEGKRKSKKRENWLPKGDAVKKEQILMKDKLEERKYRFCRFVNKGIL